MKNIVHSNGQVSGIYCIMNLKNSKIYIGSSSNIYYRLRGHLYKLRKNEHHTAHLQYSFNKYGEDIYHSFIVEECKEDELIEREEYWMNLLRADYNKVFTDLQRPASSYSTETKKRISESVKLAHAEGRLSSNKMKIYVYDLQGNYLREFNSKIECVSTLNVGSSSIQRCLTGVHLQTNGYQFRRIYVDTVSPVVYKPKDASKLFKKVLVTNIVTKDILEFESCNGCAAHFGVVWSCLAQYVRKGYIYKGVYRIAVATKSGELLESLEADNQQPS